VKNYNLAQIRFCISGAAPLSRELVQQLIKVMPNAEIGQGYGEDCTRSPSIPSLSQIFAGMTETCTTVAMFPPSQRIGTAGSAGQFMPGVQARIVKEDGSLAGYNEIGELHVTGPQMSSKYLNNETACVVRRFCLSPTDTLRS
jgi:acyl-CoA synthetase (AMP-forming)/AMP-acid ligase II